MHFPTLHPPKSQLTDEAPTLETIVVMLCCPVRCKIDPKKITYHIPP